jgi:membrane peptidoglycan carboxypeptidase
LLFTPEERNEQSYMRKVREAILAAEITRRYSKDEILELYLNEFNYGNLAYGVEAASQTYFRTSAQQLTLAQALSWRINLAPLCMMFTPIASPWSANQVLS